SLGRHGSAVYGLAIIGAALMFRCGAGRRRTRLSFSSTQRERLNPSHEAGRRPSRNSNLRQGKSLGLDCILSPYLELLLEPWVMPRDLTCSVSADPAMCVAAG